MTAIRLSRPLHLLFAALTYSLGAVIVGVVQQAINDLLINHYNIGHATLQLECADCDPDVMYCLEVDVHEHVGK